jgi:hypothetical protein
MPASSSVPGKVLWPIGSRSEAPRIKGTSANPQVGDEGAAWVG